MTHNNAPTQNKWLTYRRACIIVDVFMLVAVALFVIILFSRSSTPSYDVDRSIYPVKGIDVSAHNGTVDFQQVAADTVTFVILKATEGTDFCDARFVENYRKARAAGLKVGAYHFFRFDTPGEVQAQHFIESVDTLEFDLPLAIDVETWGNPRGYNDYDVRHNLRLMLSHIRQAGYPVIIYTNKRGHSDYIADEFDDLPLWICALSAPPKQSPWHLWQHRHNGRVKGIMGDVDLNTFNGTYEAFCGWTKPFKINAKIDTQ